MTEHLDRALREHALPAIKASGVLAVPTIEIVDTGNYAWVRDEA